MIGILSMMGIGLLLWVMGKSYSLPIVTVYCCGAATNAWYSYSQTELDNTCDLGYYIREVDDSPYSSRSMRRKVLTKSGTKKEPITNPVQWAPESASRL
jgi:hypothetical protein